jgi:hypothetical protein
MTTLGNALREIGVGPVVVLLREKTSDVKTAVVPKGPRESDGVQVVSVPGEDPIRLRAAAFREVGRDSDVWEFRVLERHPETGTDVQTIWYVCGKDILCIMAQAKVV